MEPAGLVRSQDKAERRGSQLIQDKAEPAGSRHSQARAEYQGSLHSLELAECQGSVVLADLVGFSGFSGAGPSGISGFSAATGISGFSAFSGQSGTSGFSAFSGTSGVSGSSGIASTDQCAQTYFQATGVDATNNNIIWQENYSKGIASNDTSIIVAGFAQGYSGYTGQGNIGRSADGGKTWTFTDVISDSTLYRASSVAYSPALKRYVTVGNNSTYNNASNYSDDDGVTWTKGNLPYGSGGAYWWTSVAWSPELAMFCAVGYWGIDASGQPRIATSTDGINWTLHALDSDGDAHTISFTQVIWAGGSIQKFVVCGYNYSNVTTKQFVYSSNGTNWYYGTPPAGENQNSWNAMAYSQEQGKIIAVAQVVSGSGTSQLCSSTDGITWTKITYTTGIAQYTSIAYSPALNEWVIIGSNGANYNMARSKDGINWTGVATPTQSYGILNRYIAWIPNPGRFIYLRTFYNTDDRGISKIFYGESECIIGPSGFSGQGGFSGVSGFSGMYSGYSGYSGVSGTSGEIGFSGVSGFSALGFPGDNYPIGYRSSAVGHLNTSNGSQSNAFGYNNSTGLYTNGSNAFGRPQPGLSGPFRILAQSSGPCHTAHRGSGLPACQRPRKPDGPVRRRSVTRYGSRDCH